MKFLLKIVFAPAIAVLAVLIWFCGLTLKLSAWVFGIIGTILGFLGMAILLLDNTTNGIIVLVIAFPASPSDFRCWRLDDRSDAKVPLLCSGCNLRINDLSKVGPK